MNQQQHTIKTHAHHSLNFSTNDDDMKSDSILATDTKHFLLFAFTTDTQPISYIVACFIKQIICFYSKCYYFILKTAINFTMSFLFHKLSIHYLLMTTKYLLCYYLDV